MHVRIPCVRPVNDLVIRPGRPRRDPVFVSRDGQRNCAAESADFAKKVSRTWVPNHPLGIAQISLRHLIIGRAVYWFDVDDNRRTVRILAIFFGGQDHILGRRADPGISDSGHERCHIRVAWPPMLSQNATFNPFVTSGRVTSGRHLGVCPSVTQVVTRSRPVFSACGNRVRLKTRA